MNTSAAASLAWSSINWLARSAHERGLLGDTKLPCRVVSVGNIQAGGAGKTPLVALVAREAEDRGLRVCILTRGYRASWEGQGGVIAPEQATPDPRECGDESALLHELAPRAWIAVGRDRIRQFEAAQRLAVQPFSLVILDDGFQHWSIRKDVEIVAVTSDGPGSRIHRDFPSALRQASMVVWTKGSERPDARGRPLVRVRWRMERFPGTGAGVPAAASVRLVTGVADADRAREAVEEVGHRVVERVRLKDHVDYDHDRVTLERREAARRGLALATTGKDWVKWRALGVPADEVLVFEPRPEVCEGGEQWLKTLWP